ncbi:hypothetical protein PJ15_0328 [Acinetobacter sp. neg1]|nr:hypothetical protein PJ15_0328 [Acinetobacter sp. neg1]
MYYYNPDNADDPAFAHHDIDRDSCDLHVSFAQDDVASFADHDMIRLKQ